VGHFLMCFIRKKRVGRLIFPNGDFRDHKKGTVGWQRSNPPLFGKNHLFMINLLDIHFQCFWCV
jgi:hypothetical protein